MLNTTKRFEIRNIIEPIKKNKYSPICSIYVFLKLSFSRYQYNHTSVSDLIDMLIVFDVLLEWLMFTSI